MEKDNNKADWLVQTEYEMLTKSVDRNGVSKFRIIYTIEASTIKEAWELAIDLFPIELCMGLCYSRIYGRQSMIVNISY